MSNDKDLRGSQRPYEAESNLSKKDGIDLFFGGKEAAFFDQVGKEMTIGILKESFILYRIDLQRTFSQSSVKKTQSLFVLQVVFKFFVEIVFKIK